ncbi:MAG: 30S ribosomal protein S20 [Alphaproteobacteria bacterium]|nr:30S ribosomal protein S20 [Alphaproteobacteria bacterium]
MANTAQARKRIRQTERRTTVNRARVTRIRTVVKRVELAILSGDKTAAKLAFDSAAPIIQQGAGIGILHRNTASRKISRLAGRIKAMA